VSHASSISKLFSDQKAIHQPGPKTVEHLTQMSKEGQEIWGIGKKDAGYWILDAGYSTLDAGHPWKRRTKGLKEFSLAEPQ
jgi:hypothetical protein